MPPLSVVYKKRGGDTATVAPAPGRGYGGRFRRGVFLGVRVPLKISEDLLPPPLRRVLPNRANPGRLITHRPPSGRDAGRRWFSRNVAGLLVGGTWRSTAPKRHAKSDQMLLAHAPPLPAILDVGVSDGVTCLELLDRLDGQFTRYHVTDRLLEIEYFRAGNRVWFLEDSKCVAASSHFFTAYAETASAIPPLGALARRMTRGLHRSGGVRRLSLLQPELVLRANNEPRIDIREYDLFSPWTGPQPDAIKVGNVLNRAYFSDADICGAVHVLRCALGPEGLLLIIDNRGDVEQSTLFRKRDNQLVTVDVVGNGTDVSGLVIAS